MGVIAWNSPNVFPDGQTDETWLPHTRGGGRGPPSVTWLAALFASQEFFSYICGKFEDYERTEIPHRNADLLPDNRGGLRLCR